MKPDTISWKEYAAGKNLPKLLTKEDIFKRHVNWEAEKLVDLQPIETPRYFILHNIKTNPTGLYGLFSKILP